MRIWVFSALFVVLFSGVSRAQEESDIAALNTAWGEYVAATKQPNVDVKIGAAEAVLAAGRKALDPTDERLPALMANLGTALFWGDRKEDAQAVLKEALELSETIHGKNSPALVSVLTSLGDAESEAFSPGRQLKYYKRALQIVAKQHGKDSEEYADLAYKTGYSVLRYSNSTVGKKYFLEAQKIFASSKGELSDEYGLATFHLAKVEFAKGHYDKAAEYGQAALPAFAGEEEKQINSHLYTRALLVKAHEARGESDLATEHCIAIGRISQLRPEQEYLPLFRMAPRYPTELLEGGIEGHVDLSFTIDKNGFVRKAQVTDTKTTRGGRRASPSGNRGRTLELAALKAVERFRYAPKFVDGVAVENENIETRITFELE